MRSDITMRVEILKVTKTDYDRATKAVQSVAQRRRHLLKAPVDVEPRDFRVVQTHGVQHPSATEVKCQ